MESNPANPGGMSQSFAQADITSGDGSDGGRGGDVGSHNTSTVTGQIKKIYNNLTGSTAGNTYVTYGGSVSSVSTNDHSVHADNSSHTSNSYSVTTSPASLTSSLSSAPTSPLSPLSPSICRGNSFFSAMTSSELDPVPEIHQDDAESQFPHHEQLLPSIVPPEEKKPFSFSSYPAPRSKNTGSYSPPQQQNEGVDRGSPVRRGVSRSPDSFHSTRDAPTSPYPESLSQEEGVRGSDSPHASLRRPQLGGKGFATDSPVPRQATFYSNDGSGLQPHRTRFMDKVPDYRIVEDCKILLGQIVDIKEYEEDTVPSAIYENSCQLVLSCKEALETSIQASRRAQDPRGDEMDYATPGDIWEMMRNIAEESKDTFEAVSSDLEQHQKAIDDALAFLKDGKHSKSKRAKVDSILGVAASATIIGAPIGALFGARAAYHAVGAQTRRKATQRLEPIRYTVANLHRDVSAILTWWKSIMDFLPVHGQDIAQLDAAVGYVNRGLDKYLAVMEYAQKDLSTVLEAHLK